MSGILLTNQAVQAVVRPDIGRIISFGRPGGPNRLWVAGDPLAFRNVLPMHGGLRIMISPETLWRQIRNGHRSDPATDGGAWTVLEQSDLHICMQTFSKDLSVTVNWTIRLHDELPELQMNYELTRTEANPFPVHLWSIAQVPLEGDLLFSNQRFWDEPYRNCIWAPKLDETVALFPEQQALRFSGAAVSEPLKIGTFGRWIAHARNGEAFVVCAPEIQRRAYVEGSNLQGFSWGGHFPFYEMEHTGPLHDLKVGESFQTAETWALVELTTGCSDEVKAGKINMIISKKIQG